MKTLEQLRSEIDQIHIELRDLLLRRRDLTLEIWKIKKENNHPFIAPEREQALLDQFLSHKELEKDPDFRKAMNEIMTCILTEYKEYLFKKTHEK